LNTPKSLKAMKTVSSTPDGANFANVGTADENAAQTRATRFHFPFAAIQNAALAFDALLIVAAAIVGSSSYQLLVNGLSGDISAFTGAGVIAAVLYCLIAQSAGHYRLTAIFSAHGDFKRVVSQWLVVSLLLALIAFLLKVSAEFSRGSIVFFALSALAMLLSSRLLTKRVLSAAISNNQLQGKRVVLVGSRNELAVVEEGALLKKFGLTSIGQVAFSGASGSSLSMSEKEIGSIDHAVELARERGAEEVVLVVPWTDLRRLELIRDRLRSSPLPVSLLPDRCVRSLIDHPFFSIGPSLSIQIQRGPLSRGEQLQKRLLDIVIASVALIVFSPLMLMTAIAIKLDSTGTVFFRQRRNGFNVKQFLIFKFRTMTVTEDGIQITQARRFDPRITRVGNFLRRSSIDELPQLLNVLKGEMSLVGPRPHALAHDTQYGKALSEYAFRHHVKPGITGWAQVNGFRGETSRIEQMKKRIELDIWYINNWSLWLDLSILVKTALEVSRSKNAY